MDQPERIQTLVVIDQTGDKTIVRAAEVRERVRVFSGVEATRIIVVALPPQPSGSMRRNRCRRSAWSAHWAF
jgi:hypothetical protein